MHDYPLGACNWGLTREDRRGFTAFLRPRRHCAICFACDWQGPGRGSVIDAVGDGLDHQLNIRRMKNPAHEMGEDWPDG
jgi:hypothetical protein